ncbi:MAG TPA: flagellar protein [Methylomusa anaerophila]|uniref:Flagellar operon protein n=1 Tax=Methylomusa anaerophila TaxID=1930071 RepID=A0A348AKU0_9FIRM|nr:flagellar protein [Methylomusa anaerophila]BBB91688.1 hypothetical protein MAMMFC1_02372 [Methylomusa anaerophila]HML88578.1 flagellar protein [Methylomusa anaerophila]
MELANCPECGKVYLENSYKMCPDCYHQEEEDAEKVVEYLRDKNKATIDEIHKATGVKHKIILHLLRRGRIVGEILYPCESCGELISSGRICYECSKSLMDQLDVWKQKEEKSKKDGISHQEYSRMYGNLNNPKKEIEKKF